MLCCRAEYSVCVSDAVIVAVNNLPPNQISAPNIADRQWGNLLRGWEPNSEPDSGQTYFADHINKTTTYTLPLPNPVAVGDSAPAALPSVSKPAPVLTSAALPIMPKRLVEIVWSLDKPASKPEKPESKPTPGGESLAPVHVNTWPLNHNGFEFSISYDPDIIMNHSCHAWFHTSDNSLSTFLALKAEGRSGLIQKKMLDYDVRRILHSHRSKYWMSQI